MTDHDQHNGTGCSWAFTLPTDIPRSPFFLTSSSPPTLFNTTPSHPFNCHSLSCRNTCLRNTPTALPYLKRVSFCSTCVFLQHGNSVPGNGGVGEWLAWFDDGSSRVEELLATDGSGQASVPSCKKTTLQRLGRVLSNRSKMSTERKRIASTQPGSRTQSRKQKKRKNQQCFREEPEPDFHISQAESEVYASFGSYV